MSLFNRAKKEHKPPRGRLIVIDGADATGKATQTELLAETLSVSGYNGAVFDFPQYETASSALLEKYLQGQYGDLDSEAASILYAIDRFDAAPRITELLDKGMVILANRYVTSNAGHQGGKLESHSERIKFYKWLDHLEFQTFNIPKPDLTIILDVPEEIALARIQKRAQKEPNQDDLHGASKEHIAQAAQAYREVAKLYPNTKLVECYEQTRELTPKEVHTKIWELVRRIALRDLPPHQKQ